MAQWGAVRHFTRDGACVSLIAHVITKSTFARIQPDDLVDTLDTMNRTGPQDVCQALEQEARDRYVGKPHSQWERA